MFVTAIGLTLILFALILLWARWFYADERIWISFARPIALLLGLMVLVMFVFTAYMAYHNGWHDGRNTYCEIRSDVE